MIKSTIKERGETGWYLKQIDRYSDPGRLNNKIKTYYTKWGAQLWLLINSIHLMLKQY